MALKRTLVQEEYLMISTGSDPATGYLSFYPKADGNFYKRTSAGVETKLWDSTNDGTGSGLDADLLDGLHSTEFFTVYQNYNKGEIYNFSGHYSPPAGSQPPVESNFIRQGGGHYFVSFTALTGKVDLLYNIYRRSLVDSNIVITTQNVTGNIDVIFDGSPCNNVVTIDAPDPLTPSTYGIIEIAHTSANNNLFILYSRDTVFSILRAEGWGNIGIPNVRNSLKSWKFEIRSSMDGQWYTIIDRDGIVDYVDILSFHPFTKELFDAGHRYGSAIRLTVREIVPYSPTTANHLKLGGLSLYTHFPNNDIVDSVHALSQRGGTGYGNYKLYAGDNYSYNYVLNLYSSTGTSYLRVRNSNGYVGIGVSSPDTQLHIAGQFKTNVPTGTAPFVIASTTLNTNLNADLLDGYHASAFALAGSGVTSFNTRTGAVTLSKADVEAVLTGVITSHTHNYLSGSGTANYLSKFAAAGVLANSVIYEEDGLIGIGTNSPAYELHVNGTVGASQMRVQSGNDIMHLTGTYIEFGDTFNYNALFKVNANSIEISGNDMANWTAFPISIGSVGGGFGNGRYIKIDDTLDTFTINFSKVKLQLGTANAFVKTNASKELVYDTNSYALNNHTHSTYVLKAGDIMTGNLLIHKTNSGSVNAQFGIKADATSNRHHEFRITSISDSDIYETALRMFTPTPTIYSMLIGNVGVERGAQLFLGGANWDSLSIFASTDVIGNAAYVYVCDASDNVKKVPVASFGGSSGLTSVGLKMPNIFNVSNSPLIANGDIVVTLNSQAKSNVLISPNNSAGVP